MPKTEMRMGRDLSFGDKVRGDGAVYEVTSGVSNSGKCLTNSETERFTLICSVMNDLPYPFLIKRTIEERVRDGIQIYNDEDAIDSGVLLKRIMTELNADD